MTISNMMRPCVLAALCTLCCSSQVLAQSAGADPLPRFEVFVGLSVNVDYIPNRPALLVNPGQQVSQFFSHGSGPRGFDASIARALNRHVAFKGAVSMYTDAFAGSATYCQATGCATGLTFTDNTRTIFVTAGPEFRMREDKRLALFGHAMLGVVHASSAFTMAGSNVTYVNPFSGAGLIVYPGPAFAKEPSVSYADSFSDTGLAMTLGGGIDLRVRKNLLVRMLMDFNPTFLVRPDLGDPTVFQSNSIERRRQDHVRLSIGLVWRHR